MKKIFSGGLAVFALTACSNDEFVKENNSTNEIKFAVTTERSTRASNVYCNNNKPGSFHVHAVFEEKEYIKGDLIQGNDARTEWTNTNGTRYWPETSSTNKIDFYAHVSSEGVTMTRTIDGKYQFQNFSPNEAVSAQEDLLYAVKTGQSKPVDESHNSKVNLNFRHALSQIVFNAKNTNPDIYVEISGVSVVNVAASGTYTLPSASTDSYSTVHPNNPAENATRGSWELSTDDDWTLQEGKTARAKYSVDFTTVKLTAVDETADATSLTSANDSPTGDDVTAEYSSKAMLLLPSPEGGTTAYDIDKAVGADDSNNGTYFLVKCRIWNVSGETPDIAEDGTVNETSLWGATEAKDIMIPAKFTWEEGKKYIYTFVFGKGNGGYDPDPDPDPENPDDPTPPTPVLIPITFDMSVDEFVPVTMPDINMQKPEDNSGSGTENGGETPAA